MRKLMMAAMMVAGLGLAAGCQRGGDVQQERQDLAEANREASQESANIQRETQQDITEAQREGAEKQAELQQDVSDERQDVTEAQREQLNDQGEATGGSGTANAQTQEVKGTIKSASADTLTLIVPDKNNQVMKFQASPQLQVMHEDKPLALSDLKPGDEVRASYEQDQAGKMVLRKLEVEKQSAQHPGQKKK